MPESVYSFAGQQIRNGVASGQQLNADAAAVVISNLMRAKAQALKNAGRKNMLYGALWCIGGIVVTALSYQAAANAGSGRYILA
jgi:hypothetical protein